MGMNGLADDGIAKDESTKVETYDANFGDITDKSSSGGYIRRNRPGTSKSVSYS